MRITTTSRNPAYPMDIGVYLHKGYGLTYDDPLVFAEHTDGTFTCESAEYDPRALQKWYRPLRDRPQVFVGYIVLRRHFGATGASPKLDKALTFGAGGVNLTYKVTDIDTGESDVTADIGLTET